MRVLLLETDLIWTSRLGQTLRAHGHEVVKEAPYDAVIVNLGVDAMRDQAVELIAQGIPVIGHAGHKEKQLIELGRDLGCTRLATNGELTFKLPEILLEVQAAPRS